MGECRSCDAHWARPLTKASRSTVMAQACYALGYNLAIEYLADFEKTWMLDSFRHLDRAVLQPQGRRLTEWLFLEVSPHDPAAEPYAWANSQAHLGCRAGQTCASAHPSRSPCPAFLSGHHLIRYVTALCDARFAIELTMSCVCLRSLHESGRPL